MGERSYLMGNVAIKIEEMLCQNPGEWQERIWEEVKGGKGKEEGGSTENGVENFTSCKTSQIELNNKNCSFLNEAKMFELS